MRIVTSDIFEKLLEASPPEVQRAFLKQKRLLLVNIRHPSLHAKKYGGDDNLWQAWVNSNWRFYFTIHPGFYYIEYIKKHPKTYGGK